MIHINNEPQFMSLCNYLHKYGLEWHSIMSIDILFSSSYAYYWMLEILVSDEFPNIEGLVSSLPP